MGLTFDVVWISSSSESPVTYHLATSVNGSSIVAEQTEFQYESSFSCPPSSLAGCVTWILLPALLHAPLGNWTFCVCLMGRWFAVDFYRTSLSSVALCVFTEKISPCDRRHFKARTDFTAVCRRRSNSRRHRRSAHKQPWKSAADVSWKEVFSAFWELINRPPRQHIWKSLGLQKKGSQSFFVTGCVCFFCFQTSSFVIKPLGDVLIDSLL